MWIYIETPVDDEFWQPVTADDGDDDIDNDNDSSDEVSSENLTPRGDSGTKKNHLSPRFRLKETDTHSSIPLSPNSPLSKWKGIRSISSVSLTTPKTKPPLVFQYKSTSISLQNIPSTVQSDEQK